MLTDKRLWFTAIACVVVLVASMYPILSQGLIHGGPDSFMRAVMVRQILEGAPLSDIIARISPPDGLILHWTRPLSFLLAALALPFTLFMQTAEAIAAAGLIFTPLLVVASCFLLAWAAAPLVDRRWLPLVAFGLFSALFMRVQYVPGNMDHAAFMQIPILAMIGGAVRVFCTSTADVRRAAIVTGISAGVALWISVETIVPVFAVSLFFGLAFMLTASEKHARAGFWFSAAVFAAVVVSVVLERAGGATSLLANEVDRISVFHAVVLFAQFVLWSAVLLATRIFAADTSMAPHIRRLACLILGTAAALAVYQIVGAMQGQVIEGRVHDLNKVYSQTRSVFIAESQPFLSASRLAAEPVKMLLDILLYMPLVFPALIFSAIMILRARANKLAWGLFLFLGIVSFRGSLDIPFRMAVPLSFATAVPAGILLAETARVLYERALSHRPPAFSVVTIATLMLGIPYLAMAAHDGSPSMKRRPEVMKVGAVGNTTHCALENIGEFLGTQPATGDRRLVAGPADIGPHILLYSDWSVPAIPNHRPQALYEKVYNVFASETDAEARTKLNEMDAAWLVSCGLPTMIPFESRGTDGKTFGDRLAQDRIPDWLTPTDYPAGDGNGLRLFRIEK